MAKRLGVQQGVSGKTFIVQGFGNVGYWASKFFVEAGAKLIGVAEADGSIYNPGGISPDALWEHKIRQKGIITFESQNTESFTDESAIYKTTDMFIPAAFEKSINASNADRFDCKLVVEAANGPTTAMGEQILEKKGIKFLPDVLCNAGGVTVSYFEWIKNLDHVRFGRLSRKWEEKSKRNLVDVLGKTMNISEEKLIEAKNSMYEGATERDIVYGGLEEVMSQATNEVIDNSVKLGVDLRIAAYVTAIEKLNTYYSLSGIN